MPSPGLLAFDGAASGPKPRRAEHAIGGHVVLLRGVLLGVAPVDYIWGVRDSSSDDSDRRSARLAAAGAVGASVAHELRNALAVAESALFLAQRNIDDRARLVRHLDQVGHEIRRAHDVIGSVLGLARGEPVRREPYPLAKLIEAARHALILPTNVTFEVAVVPADLVLCCDPILLERVFSNLYLNAIEALDGRSRGSIVTRAWRGDERTFLEVEDDGPGLSPSVIDRIFEPLVTGKARGTGLGLALSRVIVESHGGEITATTGPRGGTSFQLWLPNSPGCSSPLVFESVPPPGEDID